MEIELMNSICNSHKINKDKMKSPNTKIFYKYVKCLLSNYLFYIYVYFRLLELQSYTYIAQKPSYFWFLY